MTAPVDFILASGSPRRRELLEQIGACFAVAPVDIAEHSLDSEPPRDYVIRLALEKAQTGYARQKEPRLPVLGSDTAVVLGNQIYGKPANEAEAIEILMSLSGRSHTVMSGVAMVDGERQSVCLVETEVHFRELTEQQCRQYWATGEPADKAGGYGIQGLAAVFVDRISGSYSNVVGLPLAETVDLLSEFGIRVWKGV